MTTTNSVNEQVKYGMLELNSQIMQNTANTILKVSGLQKQTKALTDVLKTKNDIAYAKKGEARYKAEMDSDNDGIINFDEYVKFINSQTFSTSANDALNNLARYITTKDAETEIEKVTIQNIGKAIRSYQVFSTLLPQGKVNTEA